MAQMAARCGIYLVNSEINMEGREMKSIMLNMVAVASLIVVGNVWATDMPELAKKNGCISCHAIDKKVVGPAWMDVSRKYKDAKTYSFGGRDYPLKEGLIIKVSKGGSGNWGSIPMIANDPNGIRQDDIKQLVEFVLNLAK
jgi:cytochrome c